MLRLLSHRAFSSHRSMTNPKLMAPQDNTKRFAVPPPQLPVPFSIVINLLGEVLSQTLSHMDGAITGSSKLSSVQEPLTIIQWILDHFLEVGKPPSSPKLFS